MRISECPVRAALDVFGGKWKPLILYYLKPGRQRYGQLRRNIPDASKKVLTGQLRELERDAIICRSVREQKPLQVEYSLSPYGKTLVPILKLMAAWGQKHKRVKLVGTFLPKGKGVD